MAVNKQIILYITGYCNADAKNASEQNTQNKSTEGSTAVELYFLNTAALSIKFQITVNNISISVEVGNGFHVCYRVEVCYGLGWWLCCGTFDYLHVFHSVIQMVL